jgi:hypothetical protein
LVFSVDTLVPTITAPAKRVTRKTWGLTKEGYYPDVESSLECGVEADAEQIREVFAVYGAAAYQAQCLELQEDATRCGRS